MEFLVGVRTARIRIERGEWVGVEVRVGVPKKKPDPLLSEPGFNVDEFYQAAPWRCLEASTLD